jgi:hypothetical protein
MAHCEMNKKMASIKQLSYCKIVVQFLMTVKKIVYFAERESLLHYIKAQNKLFCIF